MFEIRKSEEMIRILASMSLQRLASPRGLLELRSCQHTSGTTALPESDVQNFDVKNEPIHEYLKGSKDRKDLEDALAKHKTQCADIPIVIGDKEFRIGTQRKQVMPFDHAKVIAKYHWAPVDLIEEGIKVCLAARQKWEATAISERIKICLRAADLVSTKYRMDINATTMLGQGKTAFQAEIDAAAELADFLRFNAYYAKELLKLQPISEDSKVVLNSLRYRGLEGFVAAVSPFNFTAIGGNLATAPALMGNVVLWKPSDTAILSNYTAFKIFQEAGYPAGVINFIPAYGPDFGDTVTASPHLAGVNFTGSVPTFRKLWQQVGHNISIYNNFPRLIGECGGKNYHFVHNSADVETVAAATIRGAFEYSGQKCSACSRIFVPESIWQRVKERLLDIHSEIKVGSPLEYDTFTSSVIDEVAFDRIVGYIEHARSSSNLKILAGGGYSKSKGYFVEPTIIQTSNPHDKFMREEIFGPLLTVYVYADRDLEAALQLVDTTTPYGLTGAVFASDREFLQRATETLKMSAGNFYINDKSTGAVVGQQPFGGGRLSGTNDKAGGYHYLLKWASPQSVKETFVPQRKWAYPYMQI